VDYRIKNFLILLIRGIVHVKFHRLFKCLFRGLDVAEGKLGLEEPLVDSRELRIDSDCCLAVVDCSLVLLARYIRHGPV